VKTLLNKRNQFKRARGFSDTEIGGLLADWLASKELTCAHATVTNYRAKAKLVDKCLRDKSVAELKKADIKAFVRKLQKRGYANKTINEYMIIVRGVFDELVDNEVLTKSPAANIKNLQTLDNDPSPFSNKEIASIVNSARGFSCELALFQIGILSGMRISELLALAWEDVDFENRQITIQRARVAGKLKTPKTRFSRRAIRIPKEAVSILTELFKLTGQKPCKTYKVFREDNCSTSNYKLRMLFINSNTGRVICNESHYARYFFNPLLVKAQVPYRGPSNCRHTFASQMLTKGVPAAWIASHMGHKSTQMLFKHYGRIIQEDAPDYFDETDTLLAKPVDSAA